MKKIKTSTGVLILAVLLLGVWWYVTLDKAGVRQVTNATSAVAEVLKGPQPVPIKRTVTVEAGKGMTYSYEFKKPGRLYGHWSSSGSSAKIKGATDDTLVSFKLIGPNNDTLHNLDHQASGNFDIRIDLPGRYTFVFDNQGIIRSSARVAEIDAMYKPD